MVVQLEVEINELVGRRSARVGGKKIVVERRFEDWTKKTGKSNTDV
jgi:hypothetical protein